MNLPVLCIGPGAEHMSGDLSRLTQLPLAHVSCRTFPDQEVCIRIDTPLAGRQVVIVQNTAPPQERHLQQLFQMVEVAATAGAAKIICIVPYLAYSRQDRRTHPSEPISGLILLRTLAMLGASSLVTIDVHNPDMFREAPLVAVNLSADALFADWFGIQNLVDPVLVSPDEGGRQRVVAVAKRLGWPALVCRKYKDETGFTWFEEQELGVRGRDVVVLDDLCSSGSTFIPLARFLQGLGARGLYYGTTHFFADGNIIQAKVGHPVTIVATDTIPTAWSRLCVAPLVVRWIREHVCLEEDLL